MSAPSGSVRMHGAFSPGQFGVQRPREFTRSEMIFTGAGVAAAVLLAGFFLFFAADVDVARRKVQQKLDRAGRDLLFARDALESFRLKYGHYPTPLADGSLPPEFTRHFAGSRGGAPLYQEQARFARLDVFSLEGEYASPLAYFLEGEQWLLASRGPDLDVDAPGVAGVVHYDPTNGLNSSGDLVITNAEGGAR